MVKFNQSTVEMEFEFVCVNDAYMNLSVIYGNDAMIVTPATKQKVVFDIEFPAKIVLETSGKDMNIDTLLDINGNILADKHIRLSRVIVDRVLVPDAFLQKWPVIRGINTTYFGFNDQIVLDFSEKDSFFWLIKLKSLI